MPNRILISPVALAAIVLATWRCPVAGSAHPTTHTGRAGDLHSAETQTPPGTRAEPRSPVQLDADALADVEHLPPARRRLVEIALRIGREHPGNRYLFGSADPARGGFDCSGAMFYVLGKAGLRPPRSSAAQFDWVKDAGRLVDVQGTIASFEDPLFSSLKPGDLLFWSGTYRPASARPNAVTHVQMYLGRERSGGRRVMLGSSDGRTYRGLSRSGYGVFDLLLPARGSSNRLVGFGTPPGLDPVDAR